MAMSTLSVAHPRKGQKKKKLRTSDDQRLTLDTLHVSFPLLACYFDYPPFDPAGSKLVPLSISSGVVYACSQDF